MQDKAETSTAVVLAPDAPQHPHHSGHSHPWLRWGAVGLAALAAGVWWYASQGVEVTTARVMKGSIAEVVYATGVVEPVTWAKVAAPYRRRIVELCKCEGETVKPGDVLARLDDAEERAALTELEARLAKVREDAKRLEKLVDKNATPVTNYEEKVTQVREYEARIVALKARIADLALKSPMAGIVLKREGEIGEIVGTTANDVLLWVGQPKPLHIVADVNEDDITRVKTGQKVLLRHEGHKGAPLAATVKRIRPKGNADTKTFRAYLALPDDTPLMIGMSVEANIVISEKAAALMVPGESIRDGWVQMVVESRALRRPVKPGIRGTAMVEIEGDVGEGRTVLSPFRPDIADGARVRTTDATAR